MRKFTTEDRSATKGAPCAETRKTDLTLQDMEHLTDFTAEEFDGIANMKKGDEQVKSGWLYIKRTH